MRVSTPEAMKYITQQTNTKTTVPSYERATQKRPHPQTLIHSMRVAPKNEPRPRHGRPSHLLGQLTSKLRHNRIVHGSLALLLFCIPQFVQLAQRRVPHGPNHRLAGFGGHVLTVLRGGSGKEQVGSRLERGGNEQFARSVPFNSDGVRKGPVAVGRCFGRCCIEVLRKIRAALSACAWRLRLWVFAMVSQVCVQLFVVKSHREDGEIDGINILRTSRACFFGRDHTC